MLSLPHITFAHMLQSQQSVRISNPMMKELRRGFSVLGGVESEDDRDSPVLVKPLNSHFADFADAARSYMNSRGYGSSSKAIDGDMVKVFCQVLGLEFIGFDTDSLLNDQEYFPTTEWLAPILTEYGYQCLGKGLFLRVDEHNRPVAMVKLAGDTSRNLTVQYNGEPTQAEIIYNVCKANFRVAPKKPTDGDKPQSHFVSFEKIDNDGNPRYSLEKIQRTGELLPEYYPYLDGGVVQLLRDFLASDESVLILKGDPGTGKSSALMYAVNDLNLLPIYATKTKLITHPDFVSKLFYINDKYLENRKDSETSRRRDLFEECSALDTIRRFEMAFTDTTTAVATDDEDDAPTTTAIEDRIPMAVIEDADFLLKPRTEGNIVMGQLLNEVDGVGSHHARKLVFTTNLTSEEDIEPALLRDGRCFGVFDFRKLTPDEAVVARAAAGLPEFEVMPTTNIPLATALRKPRKRYMIGDDGKVAFGFVNK